MKTTKRHHMLRRLPKLRLPRLGSPDAHEDHEAGCMALCCGKRGQQMSVYKLTNEVSEADTLRDLGVREGSRISVLRDGNPLIVKVDGARFGIGRAAAMKVLCHVVDETPDAAPSCPPKLR